MLVEIKILNSDNLDAKENCVFNPDDAQTVASGDSYKEALEQLVEAINAEEVDTENCFLRIIVNHVVNNNSR